MNQWLSNDKALAVDLGRLENHIKPPMNKHHQDLFKISTRQQQNLDKTGTIAQCKKGSCITAKIFKVPKSDGTTSRMVWDGRDFDEVIKLYFTNKCKFDAEHNQLQQESEYDIPATPLPNLPKLVNETLNPKWKFISTVDAKNIRGYFLG